MRKHHPVKLVTGLLLAVFVVIAPTAAILHAENAAKPMASHDFTDVPFPGKEWMEPWVDSFFHMGITTGCSVTPQKFCPEDPLTRAAMAVFMGRALGYLDAETAGYSTRAYFKHAGTTFTDYGVIGESINGSGVYGRGTGIGYGVRAESLGGTALYAQGTSNGSDSPSDFNYDIQMGGDYGELFSSSPLNLSTNAGIVFELDNDNNSNSFLQIFNGSNQSVVTINEIGDITAMGSVYGTKPTFPGVWGDSGSSYGVYGTSDSGWGVVGIAGETGFGTYGGSVDGTGIYGTSTNFYGASFVSENHTAVWAGSGLDAAADDVYDVYLGGGLGEIFGSALQFFSNGGVIFELDNNGGGTDAFVIRNNTDSNVLVVNEEGTVTAMGTVSGTGTSTVGIVGTSSSSIGVYGQSSSGSGVYGSSSTGNGVTGIGGDGSGVFATSTNSYGLAAQSTSATGLISTGSGNTSVDDNYDIQLGGSLGEMFATLLYFVSNSDFTVNLDNDNNSTNSFVVRNGTNAAVFTVNESGDMTAAGTKSAIVSTMSYGQRKLYAVEATENWFEDMGSAQLVNGEVIITFDPIFAETVNLNEDYQVFLTPVGGWAELYIAEKTATHVVVRATDPNSTLTFDYRIVAKRLGYEDVRLEEVPSSD